MSKHHEAAGWSGARVTKIRARFAALIASGAPVNCRACGQPIEPGDEWDLGHGQPLSDQGNAWDPNNAWPEHRGRCNRSAGARMTNAIRRSRILRIRRWR